MIDDMTEPLRLTTTLEPRGPAGAIVLDDAQVAALGGGAKAFPVRVAVGGQDPVPLRLARMGGANLIGFAKAVREQLGVELGDTLEVVITKDDAPREVALPDDLAAALEDAGKRAAFDALAPSRRKEHARKVEEAKKPETRERRVRAVVDGL